MGVEENVQHFLLECPSLRVQRNRLKASLRRHGLVRLTSDILLGYSNEDIDIKNVITKEMGKFLRTSGRLDTL